MNCLKPEDFKDHCPKVDCSANCSDVPFRKVVIPAALGDDSEGSEYAPVNGAYKNALVEYEANEALYIYSSDGIYTKLGFNTEGGGVTKNYVDLQDATTLNSAKAYTDSEIADEDTVLKTYADGKAATALADAKSYADAKDAVTLQAAKDYTDAHSGQGGVSQEYVDQQDAATLASAQSYATNAADNAAAVVQGNLTNLSSSLSNVAFSGLYDDLIDQPDIPVITMTDTDPGEGVALLDNHFIAVYEGEEQI